MAATLGAISTGLQGRGKELGNFIAQLNSYLREFNPSLPALSTDFGTAPQVLRTYADAAPGLISTLDNLRVTSGTLTSEERALEYLFFYTLAPAPVGCGGCPPPPPPPYDGG